MLTDAALQQLKRHIRGELVRPGDAAYDTTRKLWNGMIDKRPSAHPGAQPKTDKTSQSRATSTGQYSLR